MSNDAAPEVPTGQRKTSRREFLKLAGVAAASAAYAAEPFEMKRGFFRRIFHHELFHVLDYKDGGYAQDNQQWRDLHNCGCQPYREIGGRDKAEGAAPSPTDWFLNEYGQRNPIEDRAEFGRFVMSPGLHRDLIQRIRDEKEGEKRIILGDKYKLTTDSYKKWSGGLMDGRYWENMMESPQKFSSGRNKTIIEIQSFPYPQFRFREL